MIKSASIVKWVNGENILTVDIDGVRYEYETSPFIKQRFATMLLALHLSPNTCVNFLKKNSTLIRSYSLIK